jgi:CheY-like chemotaxis protein
LVVEDNEVNQILARTILERDGHHVTIAENGRQAVTAATAQMFDLVLMDLQMPEMDGLEAARLIRATAGSIAQVPIVALTAAASASEVAACFAAGMNGVLAKPYRAQDLADAIAQHVGR